MAKKVYELATEIGVGALDLVEKLKTMGFNVRNHMASLTDDEVAKAKAAYATPSNSAVPRPETINQCSARNLWLCSEMRFPELTISFLTWNPPSV